MLRTFMINILGLTILALRNWQTKLIKKQVKTLKSYNSWHTDQLHRNEDDIRALEKRLGR